ncbi:MAG: DUF421 domain-containing protein [Eubacteriales bacterium]|nr:DUF421 domain-containing protein [Eubacteriales bacterium]
MLSVIARTIILYITVVVVMRLMGKRQIGELQPYELATAIMISELAAVPMQDMGIPLLNGLIPILVLLTGQVIISFLSLKFNKLRGIICGKPIVLIEKGKILEDNLRKELYNLNDLIEQLRSSNVANIADVEFAVLETSGQLSVIPKSQKRPLSPADMNVPTEYEGLPHPLIIDGRLIEKNLESVGHSLDWLNKELKAKGIKTIADVFFASLDTSGFLYVQAKLPQKRRSRK